MQDMDEYVELGLFTIGALLESDAEGNPAGNTGAIYEGDKFAIRAFCWCDGDRRGHDPECPPNFEHYATNFRCEWYKHASRGNRQSRSISRTEWASIMADCMHEIVAGRD